MYYPFAPENGAYYVLSNPTNGVVATFNDSNDGRYVGAITDISGLDSPEVRESADDLVQADGGTHGYFWFSRRPIVITASVFGHSSISQRNYRVDLADRASQALRADATLSWKPSHRVENLVWNPKAAIDQSNHGTTVTSGFTETRTTTSLPTGWATGFRIAGTGTGFTSILGGQGGAAGTNTDGIPVGPGMTFSCRLDIKVSSNTSGSISSMSLRANWYKANGASSDILVSSIVSTQNNPSVNVSYALSGLATAPSDAAYMTLRPQFSTTDPVTFTANYSGYSVAYSPLGVVLPYIDGDMAGYWWGGNANGSASGDYIEMFTTVRRNSPFRQTGGWVKELSIPLVSEYATLQSVAQQSASAAGGTGITTENRGSWDSYPILRINGISTNNPTITNNTTGEVFRTTGGLLVASGETLEIDTLNHTAYFLGGGTGRSTGAGQSANSFIDFTATSWPEMRSGVNTYTLSGTGTLTVLWRDTWI